MTFPDQKPSHLIVDPDTPDPGAANSPMTDEQAARLKALCDETGEPFDTALTQGQASERIKALSAQSKRA